MTSEPIPAPWRSGGRRDGLDVAGSQRTTVDVQLALDDRRVSDDLAAEVQHEMDAADGMVPVVVGEPFFLVGPEGELEQDADGRDLPRCEVAGGQPSQSRLIAVGCRLAQPPVPASLSSARRSPPWAGGCQAYFS